MGRSLSYPYYFDLYLSYLGLSLRPNNLRTKFMKPLAISVGVGNNHPRINNKTIQGGMLVLMMSKFSTVPVSTSFVVWMTSLPAVISSSKVTAACLFSLPIWALLFTVGPPDPPNGSNEVNPQLDNNRVRTNHRISSSIQSAVHR